ARLFACRRMLLRPLVSELVSGAELDARGVRKRMRSNSWTGSACPRGGALRRAASGFRSPVGQSGGWRRGCGCFVVPSVPGSAAPGRHLNWRELNQVPRAGGRKLNVRLSERFHLVAATSNRSSWLSPPRGPEVKIQALDRARESVGLS